MGKPKEVKPSLINTDYNWGDFGSANSGGVNLSPMASASIKAAQSGINQNVNQLINPTYSSDPFNARMALVDAANNQQLTNLRADAMERQARGSATQAILDRVMGNRANNLQSAMSEEDARIIKALSSMVGAENNYFNEANTLANNILLRQRGNQTIQNAINKQNAANYNAWRDNMFSGTGGAIGAAIGAYFGGGAGAAAGAGLGSSAGSSVEGLFN
jgi:hypothetical protein